MRISIFAPALVIALSACGTEPTSGPDLQASSVLVEQAGMAPGCPNNGVTLEYGIDSNANGQLEPSEISSTYEVCNGADGATSYTQLADTPSLATVALSGDYADLANVPAELDPTFTASEAANITSTQTGNWNASYAWGDHSTAGYLSSESDPSFASSEAANISSTDTADWSAAYGWGDHASAGYLTSDDLDAPIRVNGAVRMGSEQGTTESPLGGLGAADYNGLVSRRIASGNTTAGNVVARTDVMRLERDGTDGGFQISWDATVEAVLSVRGFALTASGTMVGVVHETINQFNGGTYSLIDDADDIVFIHIIIGNMYNGRHHAEVTLARTATNNSSRWMGTVHSSFDQ